MSGGHKRVVYNTRERLVSTDHNREQAFRSSDDDEVARWLFNASSNNDSTSLQTEQLVSTSPPSAQVVGGLMVQPQLGGTSFTIQAGVARLIDPDASPDSDDDVYKFCRSPGVQTLGVLTLTGGAGSTRIDVVECRRTQVILETDSRDVFDPSTGLFFPQSVTKVAAHQLEFRVRTGTAGAGFPGTALGWMPLAVVIVPAAAGTLDQCTMFDVRPLVSEAVDQPFANARGFPEHGRTHLLADANTVGGQVRVQGVVEGSRVGAPHKVGGLLSSDDGTSDFDYIDALSARNQEAGFALVASRPWYLYLAFPAGLPRWRKYSRTSKFASGRVPYGQRGIAVVSSTQVGNQFGLPNTGISLPSYLGFTSTTGSAVCVASGEVNSTPNMLGFNADGRWSYLDGQSLFATRFAEDANTVTFHFADGVTHPANARRLKVLFQLSLNAAGALDATISKSVQLMGVLGGIAFTACIVHTGVESVSRTAAGNFIVQWTAELPLNQGYPAGFVPVTHVFKLNVNPAGVTKNAAQATAAVLAWDLGP